MARPKNTELKERILAAAWMSFRENGYDATSYHLIADACGIGRNLVQYHYPKKERLASLFFDELLERSLDALSLATGDLDDNFASIYTLCTCYFQFLLQDGGYGKLLRDIVRDRELMTRTIPLNADWVLGHLHHRGDVSAARVTNGVVGSLGSFYALLYHALGNDRAFDIARELVPVMQAFMGADGYTQTEIERNAVRMRLDPTRVAVAVHRLNQQLP